MTTRDPSLGSADYVEALLRILPRSRDTRYTARKINRVMHELGFAWDEHPRLNPLAALIRKLRFQGHAILSDPNGYWIAENAEQIEAFCERMRSKVTTVLEMVAALEREFVI